jgi:hypothetical protein
MDSIRLFQYEGYGCATGQGKNGFIHIFAEPFHLPFKSLQKTDYLKQQSVKIAKDYWCLTWTYGG